MTRHNDKTKHCFGTNLRHSLWMIMALMLVASCTPESKTGDIWKSQEEKLLLDLIKENDELSITYEATQKTYIQNLLRTYGPYTFFAPNNEAWGKYFTRHGISGIDQMDSALLESIFEYHLLPFEKLTLNFVNGLMDEADTTINGDRLYMDLTKGLDNILVNNKARIKTANIEAWNGYMHIVEDVLDPPLFTISEYLASNKNFSRFHNFLQQNGMLDTLAELRMTTYPYDRNEFTLLAVQNDQMDEVIRIADSLQIVDDRYEQEVAADPDYALKVYPNQVLQYAASFVISGIHYTPNMFSSFKNTLGKVPYGDHMMKVKIKVGSNAIFINDQSQLKQDQTDLIMKNGVIHTCTQGFAFLRESPRNLIFSAYPADIWNTSQGGIARLARHDGYIADDGTYGIIRMEPSAIGAKFWVDIPDVPAGNYQLTLIAKKGGSQCKISVNGQLLTFDGTDDNGIYDFAYVLGNRGRVDDLTPNPCNRKWLYLLSIPTTNFEIKEEDTGARIMFEFTYLNNNGANVEISAFILEPAVL